MQNKTTFIIGVLLIVLGLIFVANSIGLWSLAASWPSVLLLVGIGILLGYIASPKNYGLLMPAVILIISSIPLFVCAMTGDWVKMIKLWPIFVLGPSVGFILMYYAGPREKGLLVPALILAVTGILFLVVFNYFTFFWPILFFAAGLILIGISLLKGRRKPKSNTGAKPVGEEAKSDGSVEEKD